MKSSSFTRRRKAFSNTRAAFHSTLLVSHAPHGQVDRSSSHSAGLVGSIKDRHVCHLRERHHPFRVGHVCEVTLEMTHPKRVMTLAEMADRKSTRLNSSHT